MHFVSDTVEWPWAVAPEQTQDAFARAIPGTHSGDIFQKEEEVTLRLSADFAYGAIPETMAGRFTLQ